MHADGDLGGRVVNYIGRTLGPPDSWPNHPCSKCGAALIDAIFNANARYGSTPDRSVRVVVGS